jgi:hypothetical protein
MAKMFRPSSRESRIVREIESKKERDRRRALGAIRDCLDPMSNSVASKLVETNIVETTNKNGLEERLRQCLEDLARKSADRDNDAFEIDYQCAPYRQVVAQPHIVSLYLTAFVIEKLIDDKDVVDIFGSDEDIYNCVNEQVIKYLP